jgi:hypothetical protein
MFKQYLKVQDAKNGKGLFSSVRIPTDSSILEITGPIVIDPKGNIDNYLQVGPNSFIGPSGEDDDFLNHSCDPNCKLHVVGNRAILFSLYVIPAGTELTIDYSTTSTDTKEEWQMNCNCGSNKCRKIISGHQFLDDETRARYIGKNMLPLYILRPELMKKG